MFLSFCHEAGGGMCAAQGILVFCWSGPVLCHSYKRTGAGIIHLSQKRRAFQSNSKLAQKYQHIRIKPDEFINQFEFVSIIHSSRPLPPSSSFFPSRSHASPPFQTLSTSLCPLSYTHTSPLALSFSLYVSFPWLHSVIQVHNVCCLSCPASTMSLCSV